MLLVRVLIGIVALILGVSLLSSRAPLWLSLAMTVGGVVQLFLALGGY